MAQRYFGSAALVLLTAGCVAKADGELLVPPYLLVAPEMIDFGEVPLGEGRLEILEVGNGGAWELPLLRFDLADDSRGFSVRAAPSGLVAGEKVLVKVDFKPMQAGLQTASLVIQPDPRASYFYLELAEAPVTVPLRGVGRTEGPSSALALEPNPLDFGTLALGCSNQERSLTLRNVGTDRIRLGEVGLLGSPSFFRADLSGLPTVLDPGQEARIPVRFDPRAEGQFQDTLQVDSVYLGQPFQDEAAILGAADRDALIVDEAGPATNTTRDILFIVDDSCSMQQEQERLALNFEAFIAAADATGIDYHIGVTTTDVGDGSPAEAGRLVPLNGPNALRVVTRSSSPSPGELFRANAQVGIDRSTQIEQGLEAIRLALSAPLRDTHNAGFLREEADLAVVVVSDEDDQGTSAVESTINFLRGLKPGRPNAVRLSTIGGPPPVGCLGPNGSAIGGIRYEIATRLTGGIYESICTMDWAASLSAISEATFGLPSVIFLSQAADVVTIQVFIDEQRLAPDEWSYDAVTNAVTIGDRVGRRVQVHYQPSCTGG